MTVKIARPISHPHARVSDRVLSAFEYACLYHDLETAEALLEIAGKAIDRGVARFGGDRRREDSRVDVARKRLESLQGI